MMYPQQQMVNPRGNMQRWNTRGGGQVGPYAPAYNGYANAMPQQQRPQQQQAMMQMPPEQLMPQQSMMGPTPVQQGLSNPQQQQQLLPPQMPMQMSMSMQGDSTMQQPAWGGSPPHYPGYGGGPIMYNQRFAETASGAGCCGCNAGGAGGCCCQGEPSGPYCCGTPSQPGGPLNCFGSMCDRTFVAMVFFALLSISAFATVMALGYEDDILGKFMVSDAKALQERINNYVVAKHGKCSDGFFTDRESCMNDGIDAFALTAQLRTWSRQRNAMYFLAMMYSIFGLIYAYVIDFHRRSNKWRRDERDPLASSQHQSGGFQGLVTGCPDVKGQQDVSMSDSQQNSGNPQMMHPGMQQLPEPAFSEPIEVYATPYYEAMRCAWFVMGFAVLTWTYTLMASYCGYARHYRERAKGELLNFLVSFHDRFLATVICATIYLAWPISNILLEVALWFVFFVPWYIYRSMCNPVLATLRPDLPLYEMPGCIRLDMFFMDFADIRRIGLSDSQWRLFTGTGIPLIPTCVDESTIDRDPTMPSFYNAANWALGAPPGSYPQMNMMEEQMQPQQTTTQSGMAGSEGEDEEMRDRGRHRRRDRHKRRSERSHSRSGFETGESMEPPRTGASPARGAMSGGEDDPQGDHNRRSHRRSRRSGRSGEGNDWGGDQSGGEGRRRRHRRGRGDGNENTADGAGFLNPQDIDRMLDEV